LKELTRFGWPATERDAEEKSRRERQRIHEEGGTWEAVDLEAGTEVADDLDSKKPKTSRSS